MKKLSSLQRVTIFQFIVVLFFLLITWSGLNDPIDLGYYPPYSFNLFYIRIAVVVAQFFLFARFFKSPQKVKQLLIVGGTINVILFGVSEMIATSVGFS